MTLVTSWLVVIQLSEACFFNSNRSKYGGPVRSLGYHWQEGLEGWDCEKCVPTTFITFHLVIGQLCEALLDRWISIAPQPCSSGVHLFSLSGGFSGFTNPARSPTTGLITQEKYKPQIIAVLVSGIREDDWHLCSI